MIQGLRVLVVALAFLMTSPRVYAVNPDEMLADPVLETRAMAISLGLRCVVCQNQSIDESNADLARDMRLVVRRRVVAGDSDEAVVQFLVDRYGDFVMLKPPFKPVTAVLWLGPVFFLLLAGLAGVLFHRRHRRSSTVPEPLSGAEQRRLEALLKDSL